MEDIPEKNDKTPETPPSSDPVSEKPAKEEKEPLKIKMGPFRFKPKAESFTGARQSDRNPVMSILDSHYHQRMRVFKTAILLFAVCLAVMGAMFLLNEWKKDTKKSAAISELQTALKEADLRMESLDSYERAREALKAADTVEGLFRSDSKNRAKWKAEKARYFAVADEALAKEKIAFGKNFVCGGAYADMVHIPKGRFFMGKFSNEGGGNDFELPRRAVSIPHDFWISRTEITNAQFRNFFPHHGVETWKSYKLDGDRQPVVNVDWHVASTFCRMLTEHAKATGKLPRGYVYRLPTEAEWEYACRAGTEMIFPWGDEFGNTGAAFANTLDKYSARLFAWKEGRAMADNDGFRVSAPVGSFKPNAFGLHDMSGNVWEWCHDWFNPKAYRELPEEAPVQTKPVAVELRRTRPFDSGYYYIDTTCKVIRGGSWGNVPMDCRAARRDYTAPEDKNTGIGFRVVLAPEIDKD